MEGRYTPKPKYREVGKYSVTPTFELQAGDTCVERTHQRAPLGDSTFGTERVLREASQPKKQKRKERVLPTAHSMTPSDKSAVENLPARPASRVLQGRALPVKRVSTWVEHVKSFATASKVT